MDGTVNTTHSSAHSTNVQRKISQLVAGLENDGYLIGATRDGKRYYVEFPDGPTPDVCGLMRLNDAKYKDPEIDAALIPWLRKNRPFHDLERRVLERRKKSMINPHSFEADGHEVGIYGDTGTVEVTLQGETRRLAASRNFAGIHVQGISGKVKGGRKEWPLRLSRRPDGREEFDVMLHGEGPRNAIWAELKFTD